jgi:two-component system heavy metal sensor histidine kinase CusS
VIRPRTLRARLATWIALAVMAAGVVHAGSALFVFLAHEEAEVAAGEPPAQAAENRLVALELVGAMALLSAVVAAGAAAAGLWLAGKALHPLRQAAEHTRRAAQAGSEVLLPIRGMDEWDQLASAVNDVLRVQQRTIERARTFSANAAHELRTPLAGMLGEVQVALRRERTPEEYRATLAGVEAEVVRLGEVVEALLTLSRSDSGELRVRLGTFDLGAVAAEAARAPKLGGAAAVVAAGDAALARGDALLTRRVLDNLLDNAHRHGGGGIEVRVASRGDVVAVSVTDDGPGLPPPVRARLFERFNRERGGPEGHGLGLAIAHALTAAQGGALRLEDVPGRTRFVLELPRAAGARAGAG